MATKKNLILISVIFSFYLTVSIPKTILVFKKQQQIHTMYNVLINRLNVLFTLNILLIIQETAAL